LFHESSTFVQRPACYIDFEQAGIYRGGEIIEVFVDYGAVVAGYLGVGPALEPGRIRATSGPRYQPTAGNALHRLS